MMRSIVFGCVALVAGSSLAVAAAQDDLKAAVQKLNDAQSYSWKSTMKTPDGNAARFGGPSQGKTEKDGYTWFEMTRGDNKIEIVRKGDKVAIKRGDAWQTPEELAAENQNNGNAQQQRRGGAGRFMGQMPLPAKTAEQLAENVKDPKPADAGDGWSGALTEEGAKQALSFGRGRPGGNANGPQISNAKGDVKFWTKDGVLAGYELHLTGSIEFNGNTRDIDRTTTVEFSDVGSTKVDVPDDAKKKLE